MSKPDIANGNGGEQCSPRHVRQEQPSKDKGRLRDMGGGYVPMIVVKTKAEEHEDIDREKILRVARG